MNTLAFIGLICAIIPALLFLLNLMVYRPLPRRAESRDRKGNRNPEDASIRSTKHRHSPDAQVPGSVSVLVPARNEAHNLPATLSSILQNQGCDYEVIVLDDHSTDATAAIVSEFASRDSRVRLEASPALPDGWCGKQHACHVLSKLAKHPLLVFIDADVRLAPDALSRMSGFMTSQSSGPHAPSLASGVPRQELGTFSERLLLPLIHFVLMGFLPMHAMRRTRWPSMSAGCGQLFVAWKTDYERCGGHASLRESLHDGIKLPRAFRRAGFRTDLFDATDIATCRMYHTNGDTWRGLGKNATEGLAAPQTIGPMSILLFGGQVLPFLLLICGPMLSPLGLFAAATGGLLAYMPRLFGAYLFHQPLSTALLHPFGVLGLLLIQWHALARQFAGKPSEWKGRTYRAAPSPVLIKSA